MTDPEGKFSDTWDMARTFPFEVCNGMSKEVPQVTFPLLQSVTVEPIETGTWLTLTPYVASFDDLPAFVNFSSFLGIMALH